MSDLRPPASVAALRAADQCVKCGLCLPHCPTYQLTRDEGESPRGRLALMHGWSTGLVAPDARLQVHLDGCLTCRACESVCPADVPYGTLIDGARAALAEVEPGRTRLARVMAAMLTRPAWRALLVALAGVYRATGLQRLVRATRLLGRGRLARLESLLPPLHRAAPSTVGSSDPGVVLFGGCTSPVVEPETLAAAARLLDRLGEPVTTLNDSCCGALHQHAGMPADARGWATANAARCANASAIVTVASGCAAQLAEYDRVLHPDIGRRFTSRVSDLHGFLLDHRHTARLRFRPLNARVLLHQPCTLRNVLKGDGAVRALLARIKGLDVREMDAACCGAAGSYFISEPDTADRLLAPKLEQARSWAPDFILSANVGCQMHLAGGLRRAGQAPAVMHPAVLLARQLDT